MQRRPIFFCQEAAALRTEAQKKVGGSRPPSLPSFLLPFFLCCERGKILCIQWSSKGGGKGGRERGKGACEKSGEKGGGRKEDEDSTKGLTSLEGKAEERGRVLPPPPLNSVPSPSPSILWQAHTFQPSGRKMEEEKRGGEEEDGWMKSVSGRGRGEGREERGVPSSSFSLSEGIVQYTLHTVGWTPTLSLSLSLSLGRQRIQLRFAISLPLSILISRLKETASEPKK